MKIKSFILTVFILWVFSLGLIMPVKAQPVSPEVKQLIKHNSVDNAYWSLTVRDSTGKVLESYNTEKLIRPASNLKLLTAATVLDELGPDYTFKTRMYGMGNQVGDIWQGSIVFRGVGDPSISGTFYDDDRLYVLDKFYQALKEQGITRISGNLIGNDAYFDSKPYPDGWSWDDLSFYYAVPINALSFNNNTVDLTVYARGNVGDEPAIEWFPFDTDYVEFVNNQTITPANATYNEYYQRLLGTNTIILESTLPRGYVEKEELSITNPPLYFLDTIKKYFEDGGIEIDGHLIVESNVHDWNTSSYKQLGMHQSHPLGDLIEQLNKESSNFYAEMLLKAAAAEHFKTQGTTDLGISLIESFSASIGINTSDISISDGSGMSATNLISTRDLSTLLVAMRRHQYFDSFRNSLAIAGRDGSLEHRFHNSKLEGQIRAKTGYISGVRALSGYLKTKSNKTLIFSIATNHYTVDTSHIDSIHESILAKLYERY